jgi:hypothetical protein
MRNDQKTDGLTTGALSPYSSLKDMADDGIVLRIFDLVEKNPHISQNKITMHTGVAGGLVHAFMRRIISKGWIKASQVSPKRWLYFMTPEGFLEKGRLTVKYLGRTFHSYKVTQVVIEECLLTCKNNGWKRLSVVGDNELAAITVLNIRATTGLVLESILAENIISEDWPVGVAVHPFGAVDKMEFDRIFVCDPYFSHWLSKNEIQGVKEKQIDIIGRVLEGSY